MSGYKFFHPIEIRYGDLDPQGHVNNAKYLTFFEQARGYYLVKLGLFDMQQNFLDIGVIIADIHIKYRSPLYWGVPVKTGARTAKIGNRSLTLEQCVMAETSDQVFADGTVILVAYDYRGHRTIPVPTEWREKISKFEGL